MRKQERDIERFLLAEGNRRRGTDLFHVIDLIRAGKWSQDEILGQLLTLYQNGKIVFAYEGTYIQTNPSKWTDEEWKEAEQKGTLFNSFLRGLYRMGFKKQELVKLRYIMQTISKETNGSVRPEWGFFRRKYISL